MVMLLGQSEKERGSFSLFTFHPNTAVVRVYDALNNAQTQTQAGFLAGAFTPE